MATLRTILNGWELSSLALGKYWTAGVLIAVVKGSLTAGAGVGEVVERADVTGLSAAVHLNSALIGCVPSTSADTL